MLRYWVYFLKKIELLFLLGINKNQIFYLQFYISDDWKNFPQTSFWFHTFQIMFLLQYPHTSCWVPYILWVFLTWHLVLVLGPDKLAQWVLLRAVATPGWLKLASQCAEVTIHQTHMKCILCKSIKCLLMATPTPDT